VIGLMVSFRGMPVPECQIILHFAAEWDDGGAMAVGTL